MDNPLSPAPPDRERRSSLSSLWQAESAKRGFTNLIPALEAGFIVVRNLIMGTNLAALSLIRRPRRMRSYVWESLFLHKEFSGTRGLLSRYPYDVLPCPPVVTINLGKLNAGGGFFSPGSWTVDMVNLCLLCQLLKPKVVFEIGTHLGHTTYQLALNTPPETILYTLDLPPALTPSLPVTVADEACIGAYREEEEILTEPLFKGTEGASKVTRLFGDSATFDYAPYRGRVDLFFIDGAHSYEYVRSDTLKAIECCHPGSVIAWHDFGRASINGVSQWLLEFARTHAVYSVPGGSIAFTVV